MAHLLGAEGIRLEYPTQVVFESVTLGVNDGARIGIVGRNGDGKSSLLGLLTGDGKVYQITGGLAANKNAKLVPHMSHAVKITGDVSEKDGVATIAANDLEMVK